MVKDNRNNYEDMTQFSPMKVNQRFERIYRLHLHDGGITQARNQHEAGNKWSFTLIFLHPFIHLEGGGAMFLRNFGLRSTTT
jgi:hypothetical protein